MRCCVGLILVVVVGWGARTAPNGTKLASGSSKKAPPTTAHQAEPSSKKGPASAAQEVTLHVPDMAKRLDLDWPTWTNKVQKALLGLVGVEMVKWEFEKDNLHVRFDALKRNTAGLLRAIDKFGFKAKIVWDGPPPWLGGDIMGSFLRSILTFFSLGVAAAGCGKTDSPATDRPAQASDVTLLVPAMN